MSQSYRPEIDGLRAVAILSVVFYHAETNVIPGGFVGVDIFFVISGYLITRILLSDAAGGGISITRFYERRVRRILPALFLMLAVVYIASWFVLLPEAYAELGSSMLAAVLWVANWYFLDSLEYFAPASEYRPLLHLWSLGVEEQFYLVFPLILISLLRFCPKFLFGILLFLLAITFSASVIAVSSGREATAFFSTHLRAWELLAGAVLAAAPVMRLPRLLGRSLALGGTAMIAIALFSISKHTPFPGWSALLPVGGTFMLLLSTQYYPKGLEARILSWRPLRAIGLISYSWYLWHWPMLALYRHYYTVDLQSEKLMLVALLSAVPAALSWRFVERPFRRSTSREQVSKTPIFLAGCATLVFCLASLLLIMGEGVPSRLPDNARVAMLASEDVSAIEKCPKSRRIEWPTRAPACSLGLVEGDRPYTFLLWGDSHAQAMAPAFEHAARRAGTKGIMITRGGCPPLMGVSQLREGFNDCTKSFDGLIEALEAEPEITHIFLAARWAIYATGTRYLREIGNEVLIGDNTSSAMRPEENEAVFERGLVRTFARLKELGLKVHFVKQVPEAESSVPNALARTLWHQVPYTLDPSKADYDARQSLVDKTLELLGKEVSIINTWGFLCMETNCRLVRDGVPIYRDGNHLTSQTALTLAEPFAQYFRSAETGIHGVLSR